MVHDGPGELLGNPIVGTRATLTVANEYASKSLRAGTEFTVSGLFGRRRAGRRGGFGGRCRGPERPLKVAYRVVSRPRPAPGPVAGAVGLKGQLTGSQKAPPN